MTRKPSEARKRRKNTIVKVKRLHVLNLLLLAPLALATAGPSADASTSEDPVRAVEVFAGQPGEIISPLLFGHNLETTRTAVWKGLGAEMVANRKFAAVVDGLPKRWRAIGEPAGVAVDPGRGYAGNSSVRVRVPAGKSGGLAQEQEALAFRAGDRYSMRLHLKSEEARSVALRLRRVPDGRVLFEQQVSAGAGNWELLEAEFTSPITSAKNRLEIVSGTEGTFRIGAVSVRPTEAFHGMRRDVIALLKRLKPGSLRWPGGCYAEFYRWQEGLLPVDQRPPIGPTGLHFLLPDNDDFDPHEIGIDEFLALCGEIGAEPAITVRMSEVGPEDGAALVEYCNGAPLTRWGGIRAERGHPAPHGVKYWFLGNELWSFGRGGLTDPRTAARQTARFAAAMKKVDPAIVLIGVGYASGSWNRIMLEEVGDPVVWFSEHQYLGRDARSGLMEARAALQQAVAAFGGVPTDRPFGITFDEWNSFWGTSGSMSMALNAAGILSLLCREAGPLQVKASYFFQPVNEGAIAVEPLGARMEPVGEVFELLAGHQGNRILRTTGVTDEADLEVCVSLQPGNREILATVVNGDPNENRRFALQIHDFGGPIESRVTMLVPQQTALPADAPSVRRSWPGMKETYTSVTTLDEFRRVEGPRRKVEGSTFSVILPPGAIAALRFVTEPSRP